MLKSKIVNICRTLVHFYVRLKYFRDGKELVSKVIRIRENKHSVFLDIMINLHFPKTHQ